MFKKLGRWFRRPAKTAGHVYYARLKTPQGVFYKLGYTAKASLADRLAYAGMGDEKLIDREFFFTFRLDAWDVEQTLLEHFERQRAFGKYSNNPAMPLNGRGQSELFRSDVLGLDDELYARIEQPASNSNSDATLRYEEQKDSLFVLLIGILLAPFTFGVSLLFIFGGVAGFLGLGDSGKSPPRGVAKPAHPPAIEALVNSLHRGVQRPAGSA